MDFMIIEFFIFIFITNYDFVNVNVQAKKNA